MDPRQAKIIRNLKDAPHIQWQCDNLKEFEEFLDAFHVRMQPAPDDCLMIQGYGGLNVLLAPGDCLVLDGDQLGIVRAPQDSDTQH